MFANADLRADASTRERQAHVDQRLRQNVMRYYLFSMAVGLIVVYTPLGEGFDRRRITILIPLVLAAMALAHWFPWARFSRNSFVISTTLAMVLVGALVGWTGGWYSPFPVLAFYAVVFAALFFHTRYAIFIALVSIVVWLAPLFFAAPPPDGWAGVLRLVLVVATTTLGITQLAQTMKSELRNLHDVVAARRAFDEQLRHQAFHDALTGLPNRAKLNEQIDQAIARVAGTEDRLALLFLDLDRFKVVNDSLGHEAGDLLLTEVAHRLTRCLRPQDTLARLGGDEFVVLLDKECDDTVAIGIANRILAAMHPPIILGVHELFINASIGIAIERRAEVIPSDLLRNADIALYQAKHAGRGRYALFDPAMNRAAAERLELETALRRAIQQDQFAEFAIEYQPIVELSSGRITAAEALIRWHSPEHGPIPPAVFIPLAEELGLILPLGRWILHQSCAAGSSWQQQFPDLPRLTLHVNLSVRQFLQPDLVEMIAHILAATNFPPTALAIEITESVLMTDTEAASVKIRALQELGVALAIDDFGTGYSSLAYLRRLSASVLKIDKTFTAGIVEDTRNLSITKSVITLGQALGLEVVAEGIESFEEYILLRDLGCTHGQGYHFARPLREQDFVAYLRNQELASPERRSDPLFAATGARTTR